MKRDAGGPSLSAVFVDYDNIYLSLKRKNEEAARRFAKDASAWLREIESGRLITPTNTPLTETKRRLVMNRCYGNPVPRRNTNDNSTDMSSFPFVRHHFLRAGFEVVDCPPLTAQLKNSSDIRMVMDVRDYLTHDTYFDEFVILSGDADFTPVLHRLRAHARRTVIFANDFTAAPYTAISDGEVREADLITLLMGGAIDVAPRSMPLAPTSARIEEARREIVAEVVASVRSSATPVPLEALADRAMRTLGHEKTVATGWAGAGSFSELLRQGLPEEIRLTGEPPYLAFDVKRHARESRSNPQELREALPEINAPFRQPEQIAGPAISMVAPPAAYAPAAPPPAMPDAMPAMGRAAPSPPAAPRPQAQPAGGAGGSGAIQQSIARIQEACQAPPLAPHEYRLLFEVMAKEISENDLIGAQTLTNITQRAQEKRLDVRRDDVRFVLEVVSEADPWFEQGASANLFAGRFRNFVVARCRGQGLNLSADELDLVDAWFAGGSLPQPPAARTASQNPPVSASSTIPAPSPQAGSSARAAVAPASGSAIPSPAGIAAKPASSGNRWWTFDDGRKQDAEPQPAASQGQGGHGDEFPRIVRTRMRG